MTTMLAPALPGSRLGIVAVLDSLIETEIEQDGRRLMVRSAPRAAAGLLLRAIGVALPRTDRVQPENVCQASRCGGNRGCLSMA